MVIFIIALISINPRPLSAVEPKLSGMIMETLVDTAGDLQNALVITRMISRVTFMHAFGAFCFTHTVFQLLIC